MPTKYQLINKCSVVELNEAVSELLSKGWELHGNTIVERTNAVVAPQYYQAMIYDPSNSADAPTRFYAWKD